MGTNSAPRMTNIYLCQYEYNYIQQLKVGNKTEELRLLKMIFRYQDDLLVVNDKGFFHFSYEDIYHKEMVLKKTNISPSVVNFLDNTISVYQGKFLFKLFDKRNEFKFNVINYPHTSGNVPKAPTDGIFNSQLIRFCNINSSCKNYFIARLYYAKLVNQSFDKSRLRRKFDEFCEHYIFCWSKFGMNIQTNV